MTTYGGETVGARLAAVAQSAPTRTALVERSAAVTFAELDASATAIARRVVAARNRPTDGVALYFERKAPAIRSIFGAARSGMPYVLLDAGDPEARLAFLLSDSAPVAMLTDGSLVERARRIAPDGCVIIDVDTVEPSDAAQPLPEVSPDATLYLCYTSGSTGQPKGARQTHRNLLFFADAYARALQIGKLDRHSLVYTLSFNAANMDVFGGLLHGATVCAYDMRGDGIGALADWLDRERITILHAVPTVFRELCKRMPPGRVLPHLRVVDLGGEAVFASDVDLFRGHTHERSVLVNQLASTEVGLIAQYVVGHARAALATAIVPVGRCPPGVRVDIVREDGSTAAAGEVGEMHICSTHVSPGYWQRPALDASAFREDARERGGRCYRSGDLGFVDAAGDLHFLGRTGSRVKIRGHSVDLTEVEAALSGCPGIAKAAVLLAEGDLAGVPGRLAAFVTAQEGASRDAVLIRRQLAARVPAYMIPAAIAFVDALPLTASGKIDRHALGEFAVPSAADARDVEAPADDVEATIAAIFEQLLALAPVGRHDDFFLLGGDSLQGVELQTRLRDAFGVHVGNFHESASVASVAKRVRNARAGTRAAMPVMIPLWREGGAPRLFLLHGRHGQAFVSPHFLQLLGNDQPVWAFQARGLDGIATPHATIEDMASDYLEAMRVLQPRGPYFLGALCAGAFIASVMAQRLRADGEVVLPLLLLDPPDPKGSAGYAQLTEAQFVGKMQARRAQGRSAGPADDPAYLRAVLHTAMAFEAAIGCHRPQPYDGDVYVLSSRQRLQNSDPAALRRIFIGRFKRYDVGATHAEALDPRNPVFANYLLRCVGLIREAAQSRGGGQSDGQSVAVGT